MQFEVPEKLVLFDGDCNFCNSTVRFLLKFNKTETLYFASLNSNLGKQILEHFQIKEDSIIYVMRQRAYLRMEAIFLILDELIFPFQIFKLFRIFPITFLNFLYTLFAKYRYYIFGTSKACKLLPSKFQKRFFS